jgi:23S rRNA (uracil1939-C5)-methyltransferase
MPSPSQWNYRNHARFTVRRQGSLGFVNRITRRFVAVDECLLMSPWINEALGLLQGRSAETSQISVRYGVNTGDWLIQPVLESGEIPLASGQKHYREELLGTPLRIASPSFFQVNTPQAERMALLLRGRLGLTGNETLVDAYAGVGAFAVLLAPFAKKVIAIEESPAAIEDARFNAAEVDNLELRQGRTENVLHTLESRPDAVVLDPPKGGCHPAALDALLRWRPKTTVYVSCDPGTLARDLRILAVGGLRVELVEPVDMFPQTHHVECVATITAPSQSS